MSSFWQADRKIKNVIEGGLADIVMPVFCGRCKAPENDTVERSSCDTCPTMKWEAEVEAIIINEGAEYMMRLAKEWKTANRNKGKAKPSKLFTNFIE